MSLRVGRGQSVLEKADADLPNGCEAEAVLRQNYEESFNDWLGFRLLAIAFYG